MSSKQVLKKILVCLTVAFFLTSASLIICGKALANEDNNPFSLWVGNSEAGEDYIKVRGYLPQQIGASYFSLEVKAYEGEILVEEKKFPPRSVPEFSVQVKSVRDYQLKMIALNDRQDPVLASETIRIPGSRFLGDHLYEEADTGSGCTSTALNIYAGLEATIDEIQCDTFPYINALVSVKKDGNNVENLTAQNFSVLEDGLLPSEQIEVFPPQAGNADRIADFVFVFDHSGSMNDDLARMRNAIGNFTTALSQSNIDYRLAFMPYESSPTIYHAGALTDSVPSFLGDVDYLLSHWPGGGTENAFKALQAAVQQIQWRPGAQKVIILTTDEDDDNGGPTLAGIKQILTNAQVTVYAIIDSSFGHASSDFCAAGSVTNATNGRCYSIYSPNFNDVLNDITQATSAKYIVKYRTSNLDTQSGSRNLEITVNVDGDTVTPTKSYDPIKCNQIVISLDPDTQKLFLSGQRENRDLPIRAKVTHEDPTRPITVRLYYKNNQIGYQNVQMSSIGNDLYQAQVPANQVVDPFIHFYISASDGSQTVTLPGTDAANHPFTISVLPNLPPAITHSPVSSASPGSDIPISATIKDNTNRVAKAVVYYRKKGARSYNALNMQSSGNDNYMADIPGQDVQPPGVEYYIYAEDDFAAFQSSGTPDNPYFISVVDTSAPPAGYLDIGKIRVWGNQITGDCSGSRCNSVCIVSGNVKVGTITGNKPLLGR